MAQADDTENPFAEFLMDNGTEDMKSNGNNNSDNNNDRNNTVKETKYYDLLGVATSASSTDINKAYKKKAKKLHPDRNKTMSKEEAIDAFRELTEVYEVLKDKHLRSQYDQFGESHVKGKIDISKININDLMSMFDTLYEPSESDLKQPPSIVVFARINNNDIESGCKYITYDRNVTCEICDNGKLNNNQDCPDCGGKGYIILNNQVIEVKLDESDKTEKENDKVYHHKGHLLKKYREQGDVIVKLRYWQAPSVPSKEKKIIKIEISLAEAVNGFDINQTNRKDMKDIFVKLNKMLPIQSGTQIPINNNNNNTVFELIVKTPDLNKIFGNNKQNQMYVIVQSAIQFLHQNKEYRASIDKSRKKFGQSIESNDNNGGGGCMIS